jgi:hypothetical protein
MRTASGALDWLEQQRVYRSTGWGGLCERLARSAYGLPAFYASANIHAAAIPAKYRHGHEKPSAGDLLLCINSRYGHIAVCTGDGWDCYTNDYGGYGRVNLADARDLPGWCGASSWFIADAYWASSSLRLTHTTAADEPDPAPAPPPDPVPLTPPPNLVGVALLGRQRFDPHPLA